MNTKLVMTSSAFYLGIVGVFLSFLPQEALVYFGQVPSGFTILLLQLIGAMYLGFAMLNWMQRGSLIGGIYKRPIVIANLMHFGIMTFALVKLLSMSESEMLLFGMALVYVVFGICFGVIFVRSPVK